MTRALLAAQQCITRDEEARLLAREVREKIHAKLLMQHLENGSPTLFTTSGPSAVDITHALVLWR